jgi:hypothetical protein
LKICLGELAMKFSISLKNIWRVLAAFWITAALCSGDHVAAETASGFVTKIASPTDFYLSAQHVVMDGKTLCAAETLDAYIGSNSSPVPFFSTGMESRSRKPVPCANIPLAVGSRVQIAGDAVGPDGSFLAAQVTLCDIRIQQGFVPDSMNREGKGGALLEESPQVSRTETGWAGTMWLNGYPMAITPGTELLTAPSGSKLSYRPAGSHAHFPLAVASHWDADMPNGPIPPFTASLFQANIWAVYQSGAPLNNGQTPLKSVRLWSNEVNEDEKNYRAGLMPVVRDPDYAGRVPGTVGFQGAGDPKSIEILADENAQKFVTTLGSSLIPEYQRALPEQDKTKFPFRFYVVRGERPARGDEMTTVDGIGAWSQKRLDAGAVAFPNGVILVPDYMLAKIGNEAQLAAILSDLITTVLQKQGYVGRDARTDMGPWSDFANFANSGTGNSPLYDPSDFFPLLRNEQTLRIGIRQMYLAGYDIREAPIAWAAAAGEATNPFTKTKRKPVAIPWYTSYSFDYINRFYSGVDYGKLQLGEKEYAQFLDELRKADPEAFEQQQK